MYRISNDSFRDSVISSASSAVTYTSVYTDSEPGRVFWGADEELSDRGSHESSCRIHGLTYAPVAPPSRTTCHGPEHPPSPVKVPYVPESEYMIIKGSLGRY
ncbi:hypothetical protein Tco_0367723 [Tanacetum coccineum]